MSGIEEIGVGHAYAPGAEPEQQGMVADFLGGIDYTTIGIAGGIIVGGFVLLDILRSWVLPFMRSRGQVQPQVAAANTRVEKLDKRSVDLRKLRQERMEQSDAGSGALTTR